MILSKNFSYMGPNGKMELIGGKVAPSNLKRANVPAELVNAYDTANTKLQVVAGSASEDNQKTEEKEKWQKEKFKALEAIEEFLEEQEILHFGTVDVGKITALLNSDITDYQIGKHTGISKMTIGNYRKRGADPLKMTLKNGVKLTKFALDNGF